jgi:CHC2 zinc finger
VSGDYSATSKLHGRQDSLLNLLKAGHYTPLPKLCLTPDYIRKVKPVGLSFISVLLRAYDLGQHRRGLMGACPFHRDRNPSLSVNDVKGVFNCFGCRGQGNSVEFAARLKNCDKSGAIRFINDVALQTPILTEGG